MKRRLTMNNTICKRNMLCKKKVPLTVICALMSASILGGCSSPTDSYNHSTIKVEPSPQTSENTEEDSKEDSPSSEEKDSEDSTSEDGFDFNQKLTLKTPSPAAGESPRILFVGNSHTFTNNLPGMFSELTTAMGHQSDVQEVTEGTYTLTQFADSADPAGSVVNQKLREETWDFVILQENTNDAFSTPEETMLPAAKTLDEKIRTAGGQTGVLMTWSPKEGASIWSLEDVQSILAQNTITVSEELDSLLIPGGVAFMRCMEQYPQIELWGEDGMHPSVAGSYLAACTAYAVIFQQSPEGCAYTADLDAKTAAQLQSLSAGFIKK